MAKRKISPAEFGQGLREHRSALGITQTEAAHRAAVSQPQYARWERGLNRPTQQTLRLLGDTLGFFPAGAPKSKTALASSVTPAVTTPAKQGQSHTESARSSVPFSRADYDSQAIRPGAPQEAMRDYDKLARSQARLKTALRIVLDAAFWAPITIKADPDNDYDKYPEHKYRDETAVSMITRQFKQFKHTQLPFQFALRDMAQFGMVTGITVADPAFESCDGEWMLRALKTKPSWDFHPWVDPWGNLLQLHHLTDGTWLHPDEVVYGVWPLLHGENYLGISEVEAIRHEIEIYNKNRAQRDRMIHKRALTPMGVKYDVAMDKTQKADTMAAVRGLASNEVLEIPSLRNPQTGGLVPSVEIEPFRDNVSSSAQTAMDSSIDEMGKEISRTIGIPDTMGTTDTSNGNYALGRVQFDAFMARPKAVQEWLSQLVRSQIIYKIIYYNYPSWVMDPNYNLPIMVFEVDDTERQQQQQAMAIQLKAAGIINSEEAREMAGFQPTPNMIEEDAT